MLKFVNTHRMLVEAATAASAELCWELGSSAERRPNYDRALAGRRAR
jgi:hypothetical protein